MPSLGLDTRSHDRGRRLAVAARMGAAGVLPFVALEALARGGVSRGFPVALFAVMWLLAGGSVFAWREAALSRRGRGEAGRYPVGAWAALAVSLLAAALWAALVRDQFPCFLGVTNCD